MGERTLIWFHWETHYLLSIITLEIYPAMFNLSPTWWEFLH